jgi:hypothetical protein
MKKTIVNTETVFKTKSIKLTERIIEVSSKDFIDELFLCCYNYKHYLKIPFLDKDLFNEYFKTKLTVLEFVILMDDYEIKVDVFTLPDFDKMYKVDIDKFLNSELCKIK